MVEFDLEGHLVSKRSKSAKKTGLVHTITFEGLKLGSPNLVNSCSLGRVQMGLYMYEFDLEIHGQLGSKLSNRKNKIQAFPRDNF